VLTELRISDFAVIDHLSLTFSSGLHVLTGETGAGKSILVDALALLVGGRASADQIRSQAEEATLEAAFLLPETSPLTAVLRDQSLLGAHDTELIVRRILSRSGRNRIYLNGSLAPLHHLQALAGTLVDIHGQHEQQSLLSQQTQLDALDAFGQLQPLRLEYLKQYDRWRKGQRELDELTRLTDDRQRQEELLRFQCRELEEAELSPGEEQTLAAQRQRLLHSRRLGELADEAYEALYGADPSVSGLLGAVSTRLKELRGIDASLEPWNARCEAAIADLRDLAFQLRDYRDRLEQDPDRLEAIDERWDRLQRLKKKYGGDISALLSLASQLKEQIEQMTESDTRLAELREGVAKDQAKTAETAMELSRQRKQAARKMQTRVTTELEGLRMERTRFQIQVSDDEEDHYGPTGRDRIDYLLSANAGEPLQPLSRVASGGELSRVMLAIKSVLAETDGVPILIFDEVDAGIGGAVAAGMGRRLRELAKYHQVFCITHLPQIASQAQHHFLVEKGVHGKPKRTVTRVRLLDQAARHEEIARMLAGLAITRSVRQTAAEMIGDAGET
jgi:DNA repair protein RecN (Recombination protein N)